MTLASKIYKQHESIKLTFFALRLKSRRDRLFIVYLYKASDFTEQ